MISIRLSAPETTAWANWINDCVEETRKLVESVADGSRLDVTNLYKRDSIKKSFYFAKDGPFGGRCAYCQIDLAAQHPDIDHYRPKAEVTDEKDVMVTDHSSTQHPGYYWLAYDWENLLPSCHRCNRPSKEESMGKRCRFPIQGARAWCPDDDLEQERPQILSPVAHTPEDHFDIEICEKSSHGILVPKSPEGRITIDIFGLNSRSDLLKQRYSEYKSAQAILMQSLFDPTSDYAKQKVREVKDSCGPGAIAIRCYFKQVELLI